MSRRLVRKNQQRPSLVDESDGDLSGGASPPFPPISRCQQNQGDPSGDPELNDGSDHTPARNEGSASPQGSISPEEVPSSSVQRRRVIKKKRVPKRGPEYFLSDNNAGIYRTWSTPASIAELRSNCNISERIEIRIPEPLERPWDCPYGYVCLYESYFYSARLWFPLPHLLVSYCGERQIAISQLTTMSIAHLLGLMFLGEELGITVDIRFLEEALAIKTASGKKSIFYVTGRPQHHLVMHGSGNNVKDWNRHYFYVKISEQTSYAPAKCHLRKWREKYGRA